MAKLKSQEQAGTDVCLAFACVAAEQKGNKNLLQWHVHNMQREMEKSAKRSSKRSKSLPLLLSVLGCLYPSLSFMSVESIEPLLVPGKSKRLPWKGTPFCSVYSDHPHVKHADYTFANSLTAAALLSSLSAARFLSSFTD
eukprot:3940343-Rhodomonas_salina.1